MLKKLCRMLSMLCILAAVLAVCLPVHNAAAALESGATLYVDTDNNGPLYLREGPSKKTDHLGSYKEGTAVTLVIQWDYGWAKVQVDGKEGFMMLQYLSALAPGATPAPTASPVPDSTPVPTEDTTMYILTDDGNKLHLRMGAGTGYSSRGLYPCGTQVIVTARVGSWAFCTTPDGQTGYMMLRYLTTVTSGATPVPGATASPVPETENTLMYIKTGNTGKLHLREQNNTNCASLGLYPNGTQVTVTHRLGTWAHVKVDGKAGWMMLKFLTAAAPGSTPAPTASPTPLP
ncbi:MAG: hypothetical protein IJB69_09625, partial [Clostridia bacterium]|nr:hypothetical protein [Clostridia bacterium]